MDARGEHGVVVKPEPEPEPEPAAKRRRITVEADPEPAAEPEPWGGTAEEENAVFEDDLLFTLFQLQQ